MHKTDWLYNAKWGIFTHYLFDTVKTVPTVDVPRLAKKIADTGAGYYFITVMQRRRYMLAPNETYNRITVKLVPNAILSKSFTRSFQSTE